MLLIGQPLKLPDRLAGARERAGADRGPSPRRSRPGLAEPGARAPQRRRDRVDRRRARRARLAGRGDRLAGERLQQRDGLRANARGVMQIMPGTWAWVQRTSAPRPLDPTRPPTTSTPARSTSASSCATPAATRRSPRPPTTRACLGAPRRDVPRDAALRRQRARAARPLRRLSAAAPARLTAGRGDLRPPACAACGAPAARRRRDELGAGTRRCTSRACRRPPRACRSRRRAALLAALGAHVDDRGRRS